jgi:hypothetical protein
MVMKRCTKCNESKSLDQFYWNKSKSQLDYHCKACQQEYRRQHYLANTEYYKEKGRRSRDKIIADNKHRIEELKAAGCVDCGRTGPSYCFDFDHLTDKSFNVSEQMWLRWEKLSVEIAKCEVVCAWCHRIRTHNRSRL